MHLLLRYAIPCPAILLMVLATPTAADLLQESSPEDIVQTEIFDVYRVRLRGREEHVVNLHDPAGKRFLQVWVGPCGASAIWRRLHNEAFPRPLTHDLFETVLESAEVKMKSVLVDQLRPLERSSQTGTFFAVITFERPDGTQLQIDSRPSDAMALAVRTGAPIFAARRILDENSIPETDGPPALGLPPAKEEPENPSSGFY